MKIEFVKLRCIDCYYIGQCRCRCRCQCQYAWVITRRESCSAHVPMCFESAHRVSLQSKQISTHCAYFRTIENQLKCACTRAHCQSFRYLLTFWFFGSARNENPITHQDHANRRLRRRLRRHRHRHLLLSRCICVWLCEFSFSLFVSFRFILSSIVDCPTKFCIGLAIFKLSIMYFVCKLSMVCLRFWGRTTLPY